MAIYHYHQEIGKREEGKNAVFFAAYIRGEKRTCHKTQETVDFSNKVEVIYKECLLPSDAPEWAVKLRNAQTKQADGSYAYDNTGEVFSEYAWNQIEMIERQYNSQVYLHDDIAIPIELDQKAAIELARGFAKECVAKNGVFCDVAIHWELGNPHIHIATPMDRILTETGFSKKLRTKKKGFTERLNYLRESWATYANRKLKEHGIDARIDHRSYEAQGINLIPTVHVGKAGYMQGDEAQKIRVAKNQAIRAQNLQRIENDPNIVLDKVAATQSIFTDTDVKAETAKYLVGLEVLAQLKESTSLSQDNIVQKIIASLEKNKAVFSERVLKEAALANTHSEEVYQKVLSKIIDNENIYSLGLGDDGRQYYVTKAVFAKESELRTMADELVSRSLVAVDAILLKPIIEQYRLNESQVRALRHLVSGDDLALVCGYAGTGKTYMLKAATAVWEQTNHKVHSMASYGRAVTGLAEETGKKTKTIANFLESVKRGYTTVRYGDIIVIDEMGSSSLDDVYDVMALAVKMGAAIKGVGDIEQTQPVGRGAPMRALIEQVGAVEMDTILRQKAEWQRQATLDFEQQRTRKGLAAYHERGLLQFTESPTFSETALIKQWKAAIAQQANPIIREHLLIAHQNATVQKLNQSAREALIEKGLLAQGQSVKTDNGVRKLAVGERLLFQKNHYEKGKGAIIRNGQFATLSKIKDGKLTVTLDSGKTVTFACDDFAGFDYGYAATVHKVQGATVDYAYVCVDGLGWDRHMILVAMSRHRENVVAVTDTETYATFDEFAESVSRAGLNDHVFDFPAAFAIRRGFDSEATAKRLATHLTKRFDGVINTWLFLTNYQAYVEKQLQENEVSVITPQIRQDASRVAEFCDNRILVAKTLGQLEEVRDDNVAQMLQAKAYRLQRQNGELATEILKRYDHYVDAVRRNRLSKQVVIDAAAFQSRFETIETLIGQFHLKQLYAPEICETVLRDFNGYYGHIIHLASDKKQRAAFMSTLRQQAAIHQYDTAFALFGATERGDIKTVKYYVDCACHVTTLLQARDGQSEQAQKAAQATLQATTLKRDTLAFEITQHPDKFAALIEHFALDETKLRQHADRFRDRQFVKRFSELSASSFETENRRKQWMAHKIKQAPKRYGVYVYEFLADSYFWKSVSLENWRYQKWREIQKSSQPLRHSHTIIDEYRRATRLAASAWQAAFKRRDKDSVNTAKFMQRAQGFSVMRDKLASHIIRDVEQHTAAIALARIDVATLARRAHAYNYWQKYRRELSETKQLRLAHYISQNMKLFSHLVAVQSLREQVKRQAAHYHYLHTLKKVPEPSVKEAIRLAESFVQKRAEAGRAWAAVKRLEKKGAAVEYATLAAQQLQQQRNLAAFNYLHHCQNTDLLLPQLKGYDLDVAQLEKAAEQYLAERDVLRYLQTSSDKQGGLAYQILGNRAAFHFVYRYGVDFKTLKAQSHAWLASEEFKTNVSKQTIAIKRFDIMRIEDALKASPQATYRSLFGEPKKADSKIMDYGSGLKVQLRGRYAGTWRDWAGDTGGGPIKAIEYAMGMSFKDALAYGAQLSGLSESEAMTVENKTIQAKVQQRAREAAIETEKLRELNIQSAQSIWQGTVPLVGTLGERYFKEHRGINDSHRMEMRFWPAGKSWQNVKDDQLVSQTNKMPAVVMMSQNAHGNITGVQRIYLDKTTANKNKRMDNPKLSKGVMQGSAGFVQIGLPGSRLYLVEGPETGASIADVDKTATVLASTGVNHLPHMVDVILSLSPSEVILAADNDGDNKASRKTTETALEKLKEKLATQNIPIHCYYPYMLDGLKKTDWNDVYKQRGAAELALQLEIKTAIKKEVEMEVGGITRSLADATIRFSAVERAILNDYIEAVFTLEQTDTLDAAIAIVDKAAPAYEVVKTKIEAQGQALQENSQTEKITLLLLAQRINQGKALSEQEAKQLATIIATPKMDNTTWKEFIELATLMKGDDTEFKRYLEKVVPFVKEKETLIKRWDAQMQMPGTGHSVESRDITLLSKDKTTKDIFLGFGQLFTGAAHRQIEAQTVSHDRDRGRGGYKR